MLRKFINRRRRPLWPRRPIGHLGNAGNEAGGAPSTGQEMSPDGDGQGENGGFWRG